MASTVCRGPSSSPKGTGHSKTFKVALNAPRQGNSCRLQAPSAGTYIVVSVDWFRKEPM